MAKASPMLKGTIMNATKFLHPSYPTEEEQQQQTTLYQEWAERMPDDQDKSKPRYLQLILILKGNIFFSLLLYIKNLERLVFSVFSTLQN